MRKQRILLILATTGYLAVLLSIVYYFQQYTGSRFPLWTCMFFVILLLSIAIFPLILPEWWSKNYAVLTLLLAIPAAFAVLTYEWILLTHALQEYISFIILLGSLFTISGGIVIRLGARGTPMLNTLLLFIGAFFANFIGTTGASMVLIRPMLRANRARKHLSHVFIFFIFLVSNIGGLLTPLGDPPLFLGFLRGVPFVWTMKLFPIWIFAVFILLGIFFLLDSYMVRKEIKSSSSFLEAVDEMPHKKVEIKGKINFVFLLMVIGSLFLPQIVREIVMLAAVALSIYFTSVALREENAFTYHPIIEVAILFAGIFVTMVPVMKILSMSGSELGITKPWQFFWITGILSSFLDNAPTYLIFFSSAQNVADTLGIVKNLIVGVPEMYLRAISVGAVLMGANTYIGNGPNFMVKAICEENNVSMPSFFGYILWSVTFLIPVFLLIMLVFFL
ncbi:MAG: sodium:proton antiporter [Syntrophorhabdaceae bacterium]|nr:sodium:proton antiporter [Syntrophorhabdaceae bacterium]